MKKARKIMLAFGAAAVLAAFAAVSSRILIDVRDAREADARIKRIEGAVMDYDGVSYGNKSVGGVDLSGMTKEEIVAALQKESSFYQDRRAALTIDGDRYEYTMKELGENIYYKASDGREFAPGKEEEIAEIMVGLDKDRDAEEQYSIINGKSGATSYDVSVMCGHNEKKLDKLIGVFRKKYEKPVKNSRIDGSGEISKSRTGRALEYKKIKKQLKNYLDSEKKKDFEASYETRKVEPEWTKKDLKKVKEVISEFSTTFVSSSSRGHNIIVGASRIDGTCLLPGESVSFDEAIHDGSDGQVFYEADSYLNGRVVQTAGGGICQVSTTAYNALLRAGIIPVERQPHSMPVHYVPLGLDAAISAGVKDLVVENTLDVPICIRAFSDGGTLTFQIVSYKDALGGREYVPRSVLLSSLKASSYLDVYEDGKLKKTIYLKTDTYREGE